MRKCLRWNISSGFLWEKSAGIVSQSGHIDLKFCPRNGLSRPLIGSRTPELESNQSRQLGGPIGVHFRGSWPILGPWRAPKAQGTTLLCYFSLFSGYCCKVKFLSISLQHVCSGHTPHFSKSDPHPAYVQPLPPFIIEKLRNVESI